MSVSFIKDEAFDAFVAALIAAGPVYGPVAKRSKFVFDRLGEPDELRLDYDVTILPPKKLFFPPAQDLHPLRRRPVQGVRRAGGEGAPRRPLLRRQGDRHDGPPVLASATRTSTTWRIARRPRSSPRTSRRSPPRAFWASIGAGRAAQGARRVPHADRRRLRVRDAHAEGRGAARARRVPRRHRRPGRGGRRRSTPRCSAQCPETARRTGAEASPRRCAPSFRNEALWDELAADCFSCGSCNTVCPTCYCFDVQDTWNVDQTSGAAHPLLGRAA